MNVQRNIYLLCQIVILKKSELYRNWYSLSLGILTQDSPGSFFILNDKNCYININAQLDLPMKCSLKEELTYKHDDYHHF